MWGQGLDAHHRPVSGVVHSARVVQALVVVPATVVSDEIGGVDRLVVLEQHVDHGFHQGAREVDVSNGALHVTTSGIRPLRGLTPSRLCPLSSSAAECVTG